MDEYETKSKHNIAESCSASISVDELISLSENKSVKVSDVLDLSAAQDYGEIRGVKSLRDNLSRLYSATSGSPLPPENILIQPGAIAANYLALYTLLGPGDHVVCHYPTYQQLYATPVTLGAEVSLWRSNADNNWLPDFEELKSLVKENTKLIIIKSRDLLIFSDEVYRPLLHGISPISPDFPPSMLSMGYSNVIASGSMSKAYALAGLRIGWLASRNRALIDQCAISRDYTTISVSRLDQNVAAFALSPETIHSLLGRNIQLAKTNLELLERFVVKHDEFCTWTKPVAGTTAFIKFSRDGKPVDAVALCKLLHEKYSVMILPGDVGFGDEFQGYVRIGYCNRTEVLKDGLEEMRKFMRKDYDDVPLAK
nr:capreomycidine synthase [Quercus suber]